MLIYQVVVDIPSEQLGPMVGLQSTPYFSSCSVIVKSEEQLLALSYNRARQMLDFWSWDSVRTRESAFIIGHIGKPSLISSYLPLYSAGTVLAGDT